MVHDCSSTTGRPLGLLNLEGSSQEHKDISDLNTQRSPLLRLPPELRNRIYNLVLGCHSIFVYQNRPWPDYRYLRFIFCKMTEDGFPVDRKAYNQPEFDEKFLYGRNRLLDTRVRTEVQGAAQLALRVCRQVYREAALILFNSNSYVFDNPWSLMTFETRLMRCQTAAIAAIGVRISGYDVKTDSMNEALMRRLKGVRTVNIYMETGFMLDPEDVVLRKGFPWTYRGLSPLSLLPLGRLRICMTGVPKDIEEEINSWCKQEELRLMAQAGRLVL